MKETDIDLSLNIYTPESVYKRKQEAGKKNKPIDEENDIELDLRAIQDDQIMQQIERESKLARRQEEKHAAQQPDRMEVFDEEELAEDEAHAKRRKNKKKRERKTYSQYILEKDVSYVNEMKGKLDDLVKDDFTVSQESVFSDQEFSQMTSKLNKGLLKNITHFIKLKKMTKIQNKTFQPIYEGKDVLMKSETGSGKTLAFVVPMMQNLFEYSLKNKIDRKQGTFALIISPTRELCIQISKVVDKLATPFPWMVTGTIIGGEKLQAEKRRLRKGVTILIATPGRLEEHLRSTQSFKYSKLRHIILDEADRLLDMGFEKKLKNIWYNMHLSQLPKKPQVVLASATLSKRVKRLSKWTLKNEVHVGATDGQDSSKVVFQVPQTLRQHYSIVPCKLRLPLLTAFLTQQTHEKAIDIMGLKQPGKIIVFFSSCSGVDFHFQLFKGTTLKYKVPNPDDPKILITKKKPLFQVPMYRLHGNIPQSQRTKVFEEFARSSSGILLTTDVAARGLDLPNVSWIVQYDPPGDPREYLHRVGRTARLGFKGQSLVFLMPHEQLYVFLLQKYKIKLNQMLGESILEHLSVLFDDRVKNAGKSKGTRYFGTSIEMANVIQNHLERVVNSNPSTTLRDMAAFAFQDFVKAYTTHQKSTQFIFHMNHLHLGHLAKSLCIQEAPTAISKICSESHLKRITNASQVSEAGSRRSKKKKVDVTKLSTAQHHDQSVIEGLAAAGFDIDLSARVAGDRALSSSNGQSAPAKKSLKARLKAFKSHTPRFDLNWKQKISNDEKKSSLMANITKAAQKRKSAQAGFSDDNPVGSKTSRSGKKKVLRSILSNK